MSKMELEALLMQADLAESLWGPDAPVSIDAATLKELVDSYLIALEYAK